MDKPVHDSDNLRHGPSCKTSLCLLFLRVRLLAEICVELSLLRSFRVVLLDRLDRGSRNLYHLSPQIIAGARVTQVLRDFGDAICRVASRQHTSFVVRFNLCGCRHNHLPGYLFAGRAGFSYDSKRSARIAAIAVSRASLSAVGLRGAWPR
ncbi:hypothetical protein [Paraburkholderia sp. DGU8]|uniref:hypothetical protein n=1 Tax=Paraburkholderia sp. DGU8 TaxID=3161997 RepID=UPI003466586F